MIGSRAGLVTSNGRWAGLTAIVAGLASLPGLVAPMEVGSLYDGGITSSAGTFILHGQIPYRDFWLLYGPLAGYVAAAVQAVFGHDLVVMRLAGLLVTMLCAAVGYLVIAEVAPRLRGATVAVLAATMSTFALGIDLAPWSLAVALSLIAILAGRGDRHRNKFIAGMMVGFAALMRPDVGAYALAAVTIETRSWRALFGVAVVTLPVAALFSLLVPLDALLQQVIWYPLVGTQIFRRVPGPGLLGLLEGADPRSWLLYYIPIALIALSVIRWIRERTIPLTILGLLVFATLVRLQTLGRADAFHIAQAAEPAILLAGYAFSAPSRFITRAAAGVAIALPIALAVSPLIWLVAPPDLYGQAVERVAALIRSETQPDDRIFAGEIRNDRVFINPLVVYFLADRPTGTRDSMYVPGVTTTAETQQRMIDDLSTSHVGFLALDARYAGCFEATNDSRLPGSTKLDEALATNYRPFADLGAVVVLVSRKSAPQAPAPGPWVDPGIPSRDLQCPEPRTLP